MDFDWSEELQTFRSEVREFITSFQSKFPGPRYPRDQVVAELEARGWMKMCWPKEMGGDEKSPWFQYILRQELQAAHIPSGNLTTVIEPAIMRYGTDEQKEMYLPPLRSGEWTFALGYSEPNAGSDLASLETRAVKDGDEWVITGQKLWSNPLHNSHIWLAARTDPDAPKHRGISVFIVPSDTPGIEVTPVPLMGHRLRATNGGGPAQTFYDNVRVPAHALIGEPGAGWRVIRSALDHERVWIGNQTTAKYTHSRLRKAIADERPAFLRDPVVRRSLAELQLDMHVFRALAMMTSMAVGNQREAAMEASMVKVWSTELNQKMAKLSMDLFGRSAALVDVEAGAALKGGGPNAYIGSIAPKFTGGAGEIQRNIIAQRGLGLPKI